MGAAVRCRPARLEDAGALIREGVRPEDIDEWVAGTGAPMAVSLRAAVSGSAVARTLWLDEAPLAMWGARATEDPALRLVWFVASRAAPRHALAVHRHFKPAIAELQPPGVRLVALTYWRSAKHHRWLEAHGWVRHAEAATAPLHIPYFIYVREEDPQHVL